MYNNNNTEKKTNTRKKTGLTKSYREKSNCDSNYIRDARASVNDDWSLLTTRNTGFLSYVPMGPEERDSVKLQTSVWVRVE